MSTHNWHETVFTFCSDAWLSALLPSYTMASFLSFPFFSFLLRLLFLFFLFPIPFMSALLPCSLTLFFFLFFPNRHLIEFSPFLLLLCRTFICICMFAVFLLLFSWFLVHQKLVCFWAIYSFLQNVWMYTLHIFVKREQNRWPGFPQCQINVCFTAAHYSGLLFKNVTFCCSTLFCCAFMFRHKKEAIFYIAHPFFKLTAKMIKHQCYWIIKQKHCSAECTFYLHIFLLALVCN